MIEHFAPISGGIKIRTDRAVVLRSLESPKIDHQGMGPLYIEDVATDDFRLGKGQSVWARQLNIENEGTHLTKDGGALRVLGASFDGRFTTNRVGQFTMGLPGSRGGAGVSSVDFNDDGVGDLSVLHNGTVTTFNGQSILDPRTGFTGARLGDVIDSFSIPEGALAGGRFSNFTCPDFGGYGNFNSFSGFGGFCNLFGCPASTNGAYVG